MYGLVVGDSSSGRSGMSSSSSSSNSGEGRAHRRASGSIREDRTGSSEQTGHGADHGISQQTLNASSDCERFHGAARAGLHGCSGGTESYIRARRHSSID